MQTRSGVLPTLPNPNPTNRASPNPTNQWDFDSVGMVSSRFKSHPSEHLGNKMLEHLSEFIYFKFVIKKYFEIGMYLFVFVVVFWLLLLFPRDKMKISSHTKQAEICDKIVICWEENLLMMHFCFLI